MTTASPPQDQIQRSTALEQVTRARPCLIGRRESLTAELAAALLSVELALGVGTETPRRQVPAAAAIRGMMAAAGTTGSRGAQPAAAGAALAAHGNAAATARRGEGGCGWFAWCLRGAGRRSFPVGPSGEALPARGPCLDQPGGAEMSSSGRPLRLGEGEAPAWSPLDKTAPASSPTGAALTVGARRRRSSAAVSFQERRLWRTAASQRRPEHAHSCNSQVRPRPDWRCCLPARPHRTTLHRTQ